MNGIKELLPNNSVMDDEGDIRPIDDLAPDPQVEGGTTPLSVYRIPVLAEKTVASVVARPEENPHAALDAWAKTREADDNPNPRA